MAAGGGWGGGGAVVRGVVGGVIVAGGLALTSLAGHRLVGEMRLRAEHQVADATVLETRTTRSGHSMVHHHIRYRFTPPGSTSSYTATDGTGRENLWVEMADVEAWDEARRTRRVEVMYLAGDPSVNRPVKVGDEPENDDIVRGMVGLFFAAMGGLLLAAAQRERAAARAAAAATPT